MYALWIALIIGIAFLFGVRVGLGLARRQYEKLARTAKKP